MINSLLLPLLDGAKCFGSRSIYEDREKTMLEDLRIMQQ